ncbi:unnamed protein product [Phytomonas sp. EM1]|nr:unnamed protein product [Phytomonas sp. EM1]|eukprot:CCW65413.1 unnamed protein product [Phytomonas sp. isolate EM1]
MDQKGATMCAIMSPPFLSSVREQDELQPVRIPTPFPDLLPRNQKDIKQMCSLNESLETAKKYVAPRRDLPPPYINDKECDEFEDQTIDLSILNLPEKDRRVVEGATIPYTFSGPSIEGETTPVFETGMLYRVVAADGSWYYYNDTDKYEMHINFTFGAKSDLDFSEQANIYVMNNNEFSASLVVPPGETSKLLSGKVRGFKCSVKAVRINDEKRENFYSEASSRISEEVNGLIKRINVPEEMLDEERVLLYCEENGHPYVDCSFPPSDYSLYRADVDKYPVHFIPWHRPSRWIPQDQLKEVRLFRREIYPSQVSDGSIGDTYFASAAATLAEVPPAVWDLFRHPLSACHGKRERALGAYWVTLNLNGWWLPVLLDDYLPATAAGPEVMRCGADIRRLWVSLLEKAYAKVHRSYANIACGDPLEPLTELTGFPVTRFDSFWADAQAGDDFVFQEMRRYAEKGQLLVLCTPSGLEEAPMEETLRRPDTGVEARYARLGLRLHHGYTVLQLEEAGGRRLLRLRNPWGTGEEWTGGWAKSDSSWTTEPEIRAQCYRDGGEPSDPDGTFWMEWTDAVNTFATGGCCHYHRPWFDYRIRGAFEGGIPSVVLEITVADPTTAYLVLTQEDERDSMPVEYSAILLQVFCLTGRKQKLNVITGPLVEKPDRQLRFSFSREVGLCYTFVPEHSPYYVVPRIHDTSIARPYVIGFLPDTYVGNGIRVEFKRMDRHCNVFSNLSSFNPSNMIEDVAAEYQIRNPRQPLECVGTQLKDERLREFGLFEE